MWCVCVFAVHRGGFKSHSSRRVKHVGYKDAAAVTQKRPASEPRAKRVVRQRWWRRWSQGPLTDLSPSVLLLSRQSFIECERDTARAPQREDDREWCVVPGQGVDHRHHEPHGEEGGVRGAGAHRAAGCGAGEGAL